MRPLPYIELVPENRQEFGQTVQQIATKLGIQAWWLMIVFYIETAAIRYGKIDHRITNSLGATGLIQFMPATMRSLGVSQTRLTQMSNVEQLDYVCKYLKPYAGKMRSLTDVYLAVFFPVAIGKAEDFILEARGLPAAKVAKWNPLYDLNRDGAISKREVSQKLKEFIPNGY